MKALIIAIILVTIGCATDELKYRAECGRVGYRCVDIPGCPTFGYGKCVDPPKFTLPERTTEERLRRLERSKEIDEDMIIYEMMRRR